MKYRNIAITVFTVVVLVFIVAGAYLNISLISKPYDKLKAEEINFEEFVDQVGDAYTSDAFAHKEDYININGLFARLTGRNFYNDVVRMKNGMLTRTTNAVIDAKANASSINIFNNYLSEEDIKFVYVQAPHKYDMSETNYPVSLGSTVNLNADNMLKELNALGIDTIDLRQMLSNTPEAVEKYFYDTDHHWNNDGAFLAYGEILKYISEKYPNAGIDLSYADIDNWETTVYEDRFLGSQGKRVGVYYGGVDDYKLYLPKFDTDMLIETNQKTLFYRKGDFKDVNTLEELYLENEPDYFGQNTYCTYIGGDYPILKHRNFKVENGLKIMIIKDSFSLPVQAFLSTAVQEIDVVDPRYLKDYTIAEYVDISSPDMVIMMINPSVMNDESYYSFGSINAKYHDLDNSLEEVFSKTKFTVVASDNKTHSNTTLVRGLEYNTKYVLEAEDISVLSGDATSVTIALYDQKNERLHLAETLDIQYCNINEEFKWTFLTPESGTGNLSLIVYAGDIGHTTSKIAFENITLKKAFYEGEKTVISEEVLFAQSLTIAPSDSAYKYVDLVGYLTCGAKYVLSFSNVTVTNGSTDKFTAIVYDEKSGNTLYTHVFKSGDNYSWAFEVPESSEGKFCLFLYAGERGATKNVGVSYIDLSVKVSIEKNPVVDNFNVVTTKERVNVPISKSPYNYVSIVESLKNGTAYLLTFDNVKVIEGKTTNFTVIVYDKNTDRTLHTHIFNLGDEYSWKFEIPSTENGNFCIFMYAGVRGETSGIAVEYSNVKLRIIE